MRTASGASVPGGWLAHGVFPGDEIVPVWFQRRLEPRQLARRHDSDVALATGTEVRRIELSIRSLSSEDRASGWSKLLSLRQGHRVEIDQGHILFDSQLADGFHVRHILVPLDLA